MEPELTGSATGFDEIAAQARKAWLALLIPLCVIALAVVTSLILRLLGLDRACSPRRRDTTGRQDRF